MIDDAPIADSPSWATMTTIRNELQALYRELDGALARHGPVCQLSGRCCRFQAYGHTLFLSAPEAWLLVADAPPPQRIPDDGQSCPWQDCNGRCTARTARPLGCRIFFCDPAFLDHAPELSETFLNRLKQLANRYGWPWTYAPLHQHLQEAQAQGRLQNSITRLQGDPDDNHQP